MSEPQTPEELYTAGLRLVLEARARATQPAKGVTAELAQVGQALLQAALVRHVLDAAAPPQVFGQGTRLPVAEGNSGPGAPHEP